MKTEISKLLQEIAINVPDGVVLIQAADSKIIYTNKCFDEMFGYDPGELTGLPLSIINALTETSPEQLSVRIRHALEKNGVWRGEILSRKKDRSTFLTFAHISSFHSNDYGTLWLSFQSDITAQKVAKENQRLSTGYLKRILDNLFCYVGLLDTNGVIQEINNAPLQQSGIRREDVLGLYFFDAPWWAYDETVRTQLQEAIEAAKQGETIRYAATVKMGDDLVPIDFRISPIRDESGKIVGLLPIGIDISARKKTEAVSKHHKVITATARDGFWVIDLEGNLLEANQAYANMSGYSIKELETMHVSKLVAIEDSSEVQAHIDKILDQGFDLFETRHRRKDGTFIDVEVSINYMKEAQQFFAFFRDITERRKTQMEVSRRLSRQYAILDGANYSIIATDYDGLITDFNAAAERMLGYRADEMIGKQTPGIIHDKEEVAIHAGKLSQELGYPVKPGFDVFVANAKLGTIEELEWTYIRKDGTRFPVLLSITAMF